MTKKCYFCNALMNSSVPVRMYDGRTVSSCFACHGLAADAKSNAGSSLDIFCLSNASGGDNE